MRCLPELPALFVLDSTNTVTFVNVDSNVFHGCSPFACGLVGEILWG
jgi:hypothetical protein